MSVNLSSTTPAAPVGSQNVVFATDGSGSISGSVPISASQLTSNNVDLTAQTANISATNLVASPTAGIYRVSAYIIITTVDPTSSTLPSVVLTWADQNNGQPQILTLTPPSPTGNVLTTFGEFLSTISVNTTAIQYATTGYVSNTPATMRYALHIRVESL